MSKPQSPYAVLLKSGRGYKEEITNNGSQLRTVAAHKGTLLICLNSEMTTRLQRKFGCHVNYKFADRCDIHQTDVFLFDNGSNVLCIATLQRDFLLGVKQAHCRMELLKRLEWVESLEVGSEVYVTIATIPAPVRGIIQYIGGLTGEEGRKFGIEILEHRGEGTHNGEFKKQKYFKCDKDCAVFVALDKITDCGAAKAAKITKMPGTSAPKRLAKDNLPVKINDFVTFYGKYNIRYKGVAKWIGTCESSDGAVVGIEVEGNLPIADIPHHLNIREDKKHFSSNKSKVFLPSTFVQLDTSRSTDTHSGDKDAGSHSKDVTTAGEFSNPHNLVVGSTVQYLNNRQYGVIKWIGTLKGSKEPMAGVEMEDYVDNYAGSDGSWRGVKYFSCESNRGKFIMLSALTPDQRTKKFKSSSQASSQPTDVNSSQKEEVAATSAVDDILSTDDIQFVDMNPYNLKVGSLIEYGEPAQFGVIKWIGDLPNKTDIYAGLKMKDCIEGEASNGVWNGKRYYDCKPNRGMFVPLIDLKPCGKDKRKGSADNILLKCADEASINEHRPLILRQTSLDSVHPTQLNQNPYKFGLGSMVEFGKPAEYGVIKWIGKLPDMDDIVYAGVEAENIVDNYTDGLYQGVRYFESRAGRGKFVRLLALQPDKRFMDSTVPQATIPQQVFKVGTRVRFGRAKELGVIKWIGCIPGTSECSVIVKTEDNTESKYIPLSKIQLDSEYSDNLQEAVKAREADKPNVPALQQAQTISALLETGCAVQYGNNPVRYGTIKRIEDDPISNKEIAEVEMEDHERLKIPLDEIKPDERVSSDLNTRNSANEREPDKPNIPVLQVQPMLEVGSAVEFGDPVQYGVIRWIKIDPVVHKEMVAVEMDNGGLSQMPLDNVKPDKRFNNDADIKNSTKDKKPDDISHVPPHPVQVLGVGSMVQYSNPPRYGVIRVMKKDPYSHAEFAEIETEEQKYLALPLAELQPDSRFISVTHPVQDESSNSQHISHKLETGSLVQFGDPVQYGVIKRIETEVDRLTQIAEVETENNGLKKIPLAQLQPDNRFIIDVNTTEGNLNPLEKEFYTHEETAVPIPPAGNFDVVEHTNTKGIQGYQNSCYLDATLYGMFAFSDAFDILLLEDMTTNAEELNLQKRLKSDIVYPLRKKGIVVQTSVKGFREELAKLQNMKGLISEEKDPEEFLNILFKHVLRLNPFITIRRPSGIDKEFFVQLFVEPDKDQSTVCTQRLLCKMFQEQNITFVEYPTRLLLQMPRYGKRFKSFQRIIPSLELDVTQLCMTPGLCYVCQHRMGFVCNECSRQKNEMQFYCNICSPRWHQGYCDHQHFLYNNDFDTGTLQLLSVLCIETSHYVCFTRITGSGKDEWVFFDSMAERQDNGYNLPKVTHCTKDLQEFVYSKKDIGNTPSKDLPELVRRFVEDAYLCIYIDHDGVMYQ